MTKCDAICGQTKSLPFIPWLASIYVPKDDILPLIGSGVIVSERVVLTYADESYDLFTYDISTLEVYAAVLDQYDDENIDNQQFRRVAERFLHENPIDSSDRTFAVLIMNKPFNFNGNFVAPVCLDFSTSLFFHGALYGETGSVVAYGAKEGPIIHNFYKILDDLECKSNVETIDKELDRGKLCARRPETVNGNCAMVVGAGLVTSKMEKGQDVFYLKGIAIQGFKNTQYKRCVDDEFQLFININYFKDTIRKYIGEYN